MRLLWILLLSSIASAAIVAESDDYLPYASGNEWTMDATFTAPDGKVSQGTSHRLIGEKEERDGRVYYRTRVWMEGAPFKVEYTDLRRRDKSGTYSIDLRDAKAKEQQEVALPLKIGKSWTRTVGTVTFKDEVLGVESVIVNGTTYANCYHIRVVATDGGFMEDYWEAPKVGCVKHEIVYTKRGKISLALREFKPGKK